MLYRLVTFLGLLLTASVAFTQTQAKDFNWGTKLNQGPNSALYNAILLVEPYDILSERFSYYTGGQSNGDSELIGAPNNVIAESLLNNLKVQIHSFEDNALQEAKNDARDIAQTVSAATTLIWPQEAILANIDINYMPKNANYRLARKINWRTGSPFTVSIFTIPSANNPNTTVHELYHVLAARWSRGSKSNAARLRPKATLVLEEATAGLYATCGEILVKQSMVSTLTKTKIIYNEREFEGPLNNEEISFVLDGLLRDTLPQVFGYILIETALDRIFEGEELMVLESKQGRALIELCQQTAADPLNVERWLSRLITSESI